MTFVVTILPPPGCIIDWIAPIRDNCNLDCSNNIRDDDLQDDLNYAMQRKVIIVDEIFEWMEYLLPLKWIEYEWKMVVPELLLMDEWLRLPIDPSSLQFLFHS